MANRDSDDSDSHILHNRRHGINSRQATTASSSPSPSPSDSSPSPSPYAPHQPKSLSGIALRSFCLGLGLATGLISTLAVLLLTSSPLWRLPFFLSALSAFHFLEFWTTAAYNTPRADTASFLLTANWPAYAIAHAAASAECLLSHTLLPAPSSDWLLPRPLPDVLVVAGLAAVAAGQAVRSAAMAEAGPSFHHVVQRRRAPRHELVTTGVYAALRHPSYFGFFWWALGTQLVMGNAVCLAAYAAVLWAFFRRRIGVEEELLVGFFGEAYVEYRKRVGTRIPFIP